MKYRVTFYKRGIPRMIINGAEVSNKITRRLAGYEDTGLDPEEVVQLQERDRHGIIKGPFRPVQAARCACPKGFKPK